jgi:hypothetical protein
MRFPSVVFAVLVAAFAAGSRPSAAQSPAPASADQSRLTTADIAAANLPTAYDLVDRLRRPWLRRDAVTGAEVAVYQDNQNIGGAEKLRDIPAATISGLQLLSNADAVHRYGNDVKGSVIVVTPRR